MKLTVTVLITVAIVHYTPLAITPLCPTINTREVTHLFLTGPHKCNQYTTSQTNSIADPPCTLTHPQFYFRAVFSRTMLEMRMRGSILGLTLFLSSFVFQTIYHSWSSSISTAKPSLLSLEIKLRWGASRKRHIRFVLYTV